MTTYQVVELLNNFIPLKDDDLTHTNESFFYEPMDELKNNQDYEIAFEPIFKLIEKYPLIDFGSPGPFVHTLEFFKGQYEIHLFNSLNRKPTLLTALMLNRIINGENNKIIKVNLIDRLQAFSTHPLIDKETAEAIIDFVLFQRSNT
ncbi:MAG: hypothetical protein ABIR30_04555 [Chitinophagaceae bacterium]